VTDGPSGEEPDGPVEGRLKPTSPATVGGSVIVGLVGGWLLHPVADRLGNAPVISWLQPLALFFVGAVLLATAWVTHRSLHVRREWLEPHRAVNRLVLGRAAALVGALVAGGYAGYAVSWIGSDAELAGQRMLRSALAACCALLLVAAGLLLERACRVRKGPSEP
jgi:MFS family permease